MKALSLCRDQLRMLKFASHRFYRKTTFFTVDVVLNLNMSFMGFLMVWS